jgi:hypothetical protein
MPKATAVWLVENTSLTFDQIADFCALHPLEVKGIADGDVAQGIKGMDPVTSGQLTREELKRAEANPAHKLETAPTKIEIPVHKAKAGPRYTPLSRRQDRPNAILWLVKNHPELKDSQLMRLVGTTKPTIDSIRGRTHWNSANLQPQDPVTLGLCSQIDLDAEVKRAARRLERERAEQGKDAEQKAGTLLDAHETTAAVESPAEAVSGDTLITSESMQEAPSEPTEADEAASVFAKLKALKPELETEEGGERG